MSRLVFVDESKEGGYLLASVSVAMADVGRVRSSLAAQRRKGQRRIHFKSENDSTRWQVLDALNELPIMAVVYDAKPAKPVQDARRRCLEALVADAVAELPTDLVIELDQPLLKFDRKTLFSAVKRESATERLTYRHLQPHEDAGLWSADAIGWAWHRGGRWRQKIAPLVTYKQV